MIKLVIDVLLTDIKNKSTLSFIFSSRQEIEKIIEWYTERIISMYDFLQIQLLAVNLNEEDETLIISYIQESDCDESIETINMFLTDPDDDGNHTLNIGENEYLVSGEYIACVYDII
jgi:hypothetical protein